MKTPSALFLRRLALLPALAVLHSELSSLVAQPALTPGGALSFNGVNQYVFVPHQNSLNCFPFTVSAWIRTSQNSGVAAGLVNKYAAGSYNGYNLFLRSGRVHAFYFHDSANAVFGGGDGLDGGFVADGGWHHLAFTVDALGGKLYVDGVQTATQSWTGFPFVTANPYNLNLARYPGGGGTGVDGWFEGQMDEVRLWNTSLTQAQIQTNMHRSLSGGESNLVAYYRLDESAGTIVTNSGIAYGSILNGVLQSSPTRIASTIPFTPGPWTGFAASVPFSGTDAQLNGGVYPNGANAEAWFEWGTTTNYGNSTPRQSIAAGTSPIEFAATISNLVFGQTYHFRAAATNTFGVNFGADQVFSFRPTNTVAALADGSAGSLRTAISTVLPGGTIVFAVTGTISLTNQLSLDKSVTISGPGADLLALNGNGASRILNVPAGVTATVSGLSLTNGRSPDGQVKGGGAVFNNGALLLDACRVSGNRTGDGTPSVNAGPGGSGGAIFNDAGGSLELRNSILNNNSGGTGGHGTGGGHGGDGGAVYNLGALAIRNSGLTENAAGNGGTGTSGGIGGGGGAVFNAGMIEIWNSTFSDNAGGNGGNGTIGGAGGSGGAVFNLGSLTIRNSTVARNNIGNYGDGGIVTSPAKGGGIYNSNTSTALIIATTVARNSGGFGLWNGGPATNFILRSSIVAANTNSDLNGLFTSGAHNLVGTSEGTNGLINGINGDIVGTSLDPIDPRLSPLTDLGGPTPVLGLMLGSPAIDAGDDALLAAPENLSADQRGRARPFGPHVDIGAFERCADPVAATGNFSVGEAPNPDGTLLCHFNGSAVPGDVPVATWFQYGLTSAYGGNTAAQDAAAGTNELQFETGINLAFGALIHYRAAASNALGGVAFGLDHTLSIPLLHPPGDLNGDDVVDDGELNQVLASYWPNSPWLTMTNPAKLAEGRFQFALANTNNWDFTVLVSTNLTDWKALTLAFPVYQFADPASTNAPQRYYRLRWP